jgi:hypothetical protein
MSTTKKLNTDRIVAILVATFTPLIIAGSYYAYVFLNR